MRVHHLALRTRDLARAERFWTSLFQLGVRRRDGARAVWLDLDDAVLMLERAGDGEPEVPEGALDLIALRVDEPGRQAFRRRCGELGVAIEAETGFTTYVRDPDGRRVAVSTHPLRITAR